MDERRRRNAGETAVIEQVRRNLAGRALPSLGTLSHTFTVQTTAMSSRIVRSEWFLVGGLEDRGGLAVDALQKVGAAVTTLRQLRCLAHE